MHLLNSVLKNVFGLFLWYWSNLALILFDMKKRFILSHLREREQGQFHFSPFLWDLVIGFCLLCITLVTNNYPACTIPPPFKKTTKKKQERNVLHYVNQTLTCTCIYRGFIRRPMKRHTKCNYTQCAWHLAPLHKWSLQLGLMKEAICKTIQIQMTVNCQLLSSALRFVLTPFPLLETPTSLWGFFSHMIPVLYDVTWLAVTEHTVKVWGLFSRQ